MWDTPLMRAWVLSHQREASVGAGTVMGVFLFVVGGQVALTPVNALVAALGGVVFGVAFYWSLRIHMPREP